MERWNDADYARLQTEAANAGLTVSSYIRSRVLAAPTTRARKQVPVDYAVFGAALRQFAKAAINLNQIARHLNTFGFPVPPELAALAIRLDADRMDMMAAMGRG
jgi:hypothetical protein